jgi:hypothetical protein
MTLPELDGGGIDTSASHSEAIPRPVLDIRLLDPRQLDGLMKD